MIQLETSPTTTVITVVGDLDLAERAQFPEVAARVSGLRRQLLVVDMCGTTFMDSTGAAFLISLADVLGKRGGVVALRGASERELFVLEVCGALEMFRIDREHRCDDGTKPGPWSVQVAADPRVDGGTGSGQDRRSATD